MSEREVPTFADFGDAVERLTKDIVASDFQPDCILAITRGGLPLGGVMAYRLEIKDVQTINIEYYAGTGVDDVKLDEPRVLEPVLDFAKLVGKTVLVTDDVADSGATLSFVGRQLDEHAIDFRSAVWFSKPTTQVVPDFVAEHTDKWIVFPWSPFAGSDV